MSGETGRAPWGEARVVFCANLGDIKQEVQTGRSLKRIYLKRKNTLGMSYPQFTHYVRRYIQDRGVVSHDKPLPAPVRQDKPKQYQPGPRVPDPKELI